jgi:hypothetical protein
MAIQRAAGAPVNVMMESLMLAGVTFKGGDMMIAPPWSKSGSFGRLFHTVRRECRPADPTHGHGSVVPMLSRTR